ncbi:hypothetical protein COO55_15590 [Rhodococcus opacus]|nr:hypothetical protein FND50_03355 [Rhodococcus sp. WB9]RKM73344.1 hypothetical protein COO55_15590 [Rhodococcus opacus]
MAKAMSAEDWVPPSRTRAPLHNPLDYLQGRPERDRRTCAIAGPMLGECEHNVENLYPRVTSARPRSACQAFKDLRVDATRE